jgi:hypothetical protein
MIVLAISRLEFSQHEDGHWTSGDDPGQDIYTTLEVLSGLKYSGFTLKVFA